MILRRVLSLTANGLALTCAVLVTALVIRRELQEEPGRKGGALSAAELILGGKTIKDWSSQIAVGERIGSITAPVTLLEFGDFECPACGGFERKALAGARAKYGDRFAVVFRHWPLEYHRFAYSAARAAECAAEAGKFVQFHDAIYRQQDSLGLKPFRQYAQEAGVPDLAAFESCARSTVAVPKISADVKAAIALGGQGTPTLALNGRLLKGVPDSAALDELISKELSKANR